MIQTVAGDGRSEKSGDGGPAIEAGLGYPDSIVVDDDGALFIAAGGVIRRVSEYDIIRTYVEGYSGSIAISPDGEIYIGGYGIQRVANALSNSGGEVLMTDGSAKEIYRFDAEGRHLSTLEALTNADLYRFGYTRSGLLSTITDVDDRVTRIARLADGTPTAIIAPDGQRTELTLDGNGYLTGVSDPAGNSNHMSYSDDGLLLSFTDPNGHQTRFTYDDLGRFRTDTDPLGGGWTLNRSEIERGYIAEMISGEGRVSRFEVERLLIGDHLQTNTDPDGSQTTKLFGDDASEMVEYRDGTELLVQQGPDPRFEMLAPVIKEQTLSLPSGLEQQSEQTRQVALADAVNPLSLTLLTETTTINGRTTTSTYDGASRTLTTTTPVGRTGVTTLDSKGRVAISQVSGLAASNYVYNADGRLIQVDEGAIPDVRRTQFNYYSTGFRKGLLEWLQDAEGRKVLFDYDAAGRVVEQTLPDNRVIAYNYDANGNLTGLIPPGRPAHRFSYNAVDLLSRYTPPTVTGGGSTEYSYNLDKQLTRVQRPDGKALDYAYDNAGRLAVLTVPSGTYAYSYNAAGQVSSIEAPDGTLAYTYDGQLRTSIQWTGEVAGQVAFAYDNDFQVSEIRVGTDAIAYGYDDDSLLIQAGDLTLTRDAQQSLLTGTVLGTVSDSYAYDDFGGLSAYNAQSGAGSLLATAYTRDKLGRITQKRETRNAVEHVYDYHYDMAGRLVEVKKDDVIQSTYVYDDNGNRLSRAMPNGTETGTYDEQDRLLTYGGVSYSYTANGELTSKDDNGQVTQYDYDVLGNLKQVVLPGGTVIDYLTDGRNRQIGKKVNGVLVQGFLWQDQLRPIAELDGSGNIVGRFVYGDDVNVPDYIAV